MGSKKFVDLFRDAMQQDSFWVEKAIIEFTSGLYNEMKQQGKSYSDLARILNTSPAYITKVFRGNANFTIQSMVKLSKALNCRLHLRVAKEDAHVKWIDIAQPSFDLKNRTWAMSPDNYRPVKNINVGVVTNETAQFAA